MYYSGTEWALSSINQHGLWERRPTLARDGHVSVLSVDIGDFNTPSRHLVDEFGRGKAARDCTADEIAIEVWRQIVHGLTSDVDNVAEALVPWPVWYAIDRGLVMADSPERDGGRAVRNETPYLVPIIGDWPNRPGADPWNCDGSSWTTRPNEALWLEDLHDRNVWQARHGGYQVHHNSVVFAGTWTKTFTRMTSMEAACESARHAVNAVLDHYVWVESGGVDRRENTTLDWKFPYGFLDQGLSSPIRMPSPAGDYCFVFDIENREPLDTRPLRDLDTRYCEDSLPHPLDPPGEPPAGAPTFPVPSPGGGQPMTTSPSDYTQQLLAYLQAWRQYLEQATGAVATGLPLAPAPWGMPPTSPNPPLVPPMPPAALTPPMTFSPTDYTQQLLAYLQAWRQYLEQSMSAVPSPPEPTPPPQTRPAEEYVPPVDDYVNELSDESRPQRGPDTARLTDEPAPRGTSLYTSEPARERRFGSAYPRASGPVASGASVQSAPRSLYSGHAAQPAPAKWRQTDQGRERLEASGSAPKTMEIVPPTARGSTPRQSKA